MVVVGRSQLHVGRHAIRLAAAAGGHNGLRASSRRRLLPEYARLRMESAERGAEGRLQGSSDFVLARCSR